MVATVTPGRGIHVSRPRWELREEGPRKPEDTRAQKLMSPEGPSPPRLGPSDTAPGGEGRQVMERKVCDHRCGSHQTPNNPGFGQSHQGQEKPSDLHWAGEGGAPLGSVCCQPGCLGPQPPPYGARALHPASRALLELPSGSGMDLSAERPPRYCGFGSRQPR